jgi:Fe2+ or Zn2+ uptake regulation protein
VQDCYRTTIVDKVSSVMQTVSALTDLFRARGLRVTPQRQAIFGLLQGDGSHPTVEALYERARADMPTISLKTVYQTVHDLADLGQCRLLDLGTGALRVDPNVEHDHHHLVCTHCGRVRDLAVEFDDLRLPSAARRDFSVDHVQVIFRGSCSHCGPADRRPRSNTQPEQQGARSHAEA